MHSEDAHLVAALRRRDRAAFAELVEAWGPSMLRCARAHVPSHSVAEEVVQETWLTVLRTLERFEGRSSLRTWVYGILVNLARSHGRRERRALPFAALGPQREEAEGDSPAPRRPRGGRGPGRRWWAAPATAWSDPERRLEQAAARRELAAAIGALPPRQRQVLVMRDLMGLDARAACSALDTTEGNQRVLLHRARAGVRAALAPAPRRERASARSALAHRP